MAAPKPPRYSLSIVEGETTQPENVIAHVSGEVRPSAEVVVSIIRAGTVIARDSGGGGAWLSQVPNVGDVVNLESPAGSVVGSVVYDGLPSIDPTVCAGSASFSGQRSAGQTVEGRYYSVIVKTDPYGHFSGFENVGFGQAQVTVLSGSAYAGGFLQLLAFGQTVSASESLETPLAGGAVFTYSSENDRPVGACPVPPPPPPPPPAPPALQGSILKFVRTTIHNLLTHGWRNRVTINQPGTVTEDLYLKGGKLPAFAASGPSKHHHRTPPALLLARGVTSAGSAGVVNVLVKPTVKGRRRLKSAKSVNVVLITTLRSRSGAKLNLARHTITLHR